MPRAKAIAYIVFGSQGIAFTPITVPSNRPPESSLRIARDAGRSLLWLVTGRTGASLNPRYSTGGPGDGETGGPGDGETGGPGDGETGRRGPFG